MDLPFFRWQFWQLAVFLLPLMHFLFWQQLTWRSWCAVFNTSLVSVVKPRSQWCIIYWNSVNLNFSLLYPFFLMLFFGFVCFLGFVFTVRVGHVLMGVLRKRLNTTSHFKNECTSYLLLNCTVVYNNTQFVHIHKCGVCIDSFNRRFWKLGLSPCWWYLKVKSTAIYLWKLAEKSLL